MFEKEDIERLFKNSCSVEEATAIINYLENNPSLVNQYLSESEWENFKSSQSISPNISKNIWQEVQKQTFKQKAPIFDLRKLAVAASLLIIILSGIWFLRHKEMSIVKGTPENKSAFKFVSNYNKSNTIIQLSDSSMVELFPNSSISYKEFFDNDERNITLVGEAMFSVTKDKNRPFKVLSDAITTTVLGTKFKVISFSNENNIRVNLYEGKVLIKGADSARRTIKKEVYLLPGEEFVFNKIDLSSTVNKLKEGVKIKSSKTIASNVAAIVNSGNWYMFNNQPLSEVLEQLESLYSEKIVFNKKDLMGKTFIGKIDKSDSLQIILHSIGILNNLVITKKADGYYITKK